MALLKIMICWSELFPLFCAPLRGWGEEIMSMGHPNVRWGWAIVQWDSRCERDEEGTGDFHPTKVSVLVSTANKELNSKQATVLPRLPSREGQ